MGLTLELLTPLAEELAREPGRESITPAELATRLLTVAKTLLDDDPETQAAVDASLAASDAGPVVTSLLQDLVTIYRALPPLDRLVPQAVRVNRRRISALGKFAHIPFSSEDFAREKQEEIDREEQRLRR